MRIRFLCATAVALSLAVATAPATAAVAPTSPRVTLVALHLGHGSFARSGGLFRRSPYRGGSSLFGGRRTGRSSGVLRRIGNALAIGYLLHLLFGGSGGGGFLLLLLVIVLLLAHRRRRRARAYYAGGRGL